MKYSDKLQPLQIGIVEQIQQMIPTQYREPLGFILEQLAKENFDSNDNIIIAFIHNHAGQKRSKKRNIKDLIVIIPQSVVNQCIPMLPDGEAKNKFRVIANCLFTDKGRKKRAHLIATCSDKEIVRYCQNVDNHIEQSRFSSGGVKPYRQRTQRRGLVGLLGGQGFYLTENS